MEAVNLHNSAETIVEVVEPEILSSDMEATSTTQEIAPELVTQLSEAIADSSGEPTPQIYGTPYSVPLSRVSGELCKLLSLEISSFS
jgi:hypothetical protein